MQEISNRPIEHCSGQTALAQLRLCLIDTRPHSKRKREAAAAAAAAFYLYSHHARARVPPRDFLTQQAGCLCDLHSVEEVQASRVISFVS